MNISSSRRSEASSRTGALVNRRFPTLLGIASIAVGIAPLQAAWTLYQNFQNLPVGYDIAESSNPNENFAVALQEIANPAARYGGYTVILDPTNPSNQLLQLDAQGYAFSGQFVDAATGTPTPIANLTTATLFYRVYRQSVSNLPDVNFGGADIGTLTDNVNNAANYQSQVNISGGSDILRPRNGGGTVDTGVSWFSGAWFGIYQVIDTATNSSVFYYQTEFDTEPIRLQGVMSGIYDMAFRNGGDRPATEIGYFLAVNGITGAGPNDIFYLDDIYLDLSGENLVAPVPIFSVPEPSACALVLLALGGLAVRARRNHAKR